MKLNEISTGYFANANTKRSTKVHLNYYKKPICGTIISKKMEYLWCANFVLIDYVDCKKCKSAYRKILENEVKEIK